MNISINLKYFYIEMMFNETKDDLLEISIDIQKKEINLKQKIIKFEVDDFLIDRIIYGLDDVDVTLKEKNKIMNFEKERIKNKPWIFAND